MQRKSFSNRKFRSMLLTGTFTMAAMYLMLLADSIIAGFFLGEDGVAAVNLITPLTGVISFLSAIVSMGTSIIYSRRIGKMDQKGASQIYGQGLIVSIVMALITALLLYVGKDMYFSTVGASGVPYDHALKYYRFLPLNTILMIMIQYLSNMVYTDGDEAVNNISYGMQLGGNIILSVILCRKLGMTGIIIGTVIGNAAGILALLSHFARKSNTLHFTWHFNLKELWQAIRFSAVDATIYICWAVMDYVLISYIARHYGDEAQVVLAIITNLIEFCVVMDGVGLAVQPLVETYLGEKNYKMIKRLMKSAIKAAATEGIVATVLVFVFARQFAGIFGIRDAMVLTHCVRALRIVCLSMTFCSLLSLTTSYYMLIEHIGLSIAITVLKDGVLYTLLPLVFSLLWGESGIWTGFTAAAPIALALSFMFVYLTCDRSIFPWLLENTDDRIVVLENEITKENAVALSRAVDDELKRRGVSSKTATHAALFTEEILLTIIEKNNTEIDLLLTEITLFFEDDSVLLIERDSGEIFDITDPDLKIDGLSSFILEGLMESHKEKAYQTTTGYNRNIMRFEI